MQHRPERAGTPSMVSQAAQQQQQLQQVATRAGSWARTQPAEAAASLPFASLADRRQSTSEHLQAAASGDQQLPATPCMAGLLPEEAPVIQQQLSMLRGQPQLQQQRQRQRQRQRPQPRTLQAVQEDMQRVQARITAVQMDNEQVRWESRCLLTCKLVHGRSYWTLLQLRSDNAVLVEHVLRIYQRVGIEPDAGGPRFQLS